MGELFRKGQRKEREGKGNKRENLRRRLAGSGES